MEQYKKLLQRILDKGTWKDAARENMPKTLSLFGDQLRFDLQDGFPLVTTKKVNFKHIVTELLWFLRGDTNIKYLVDNNCSIWNEDAYNYYIKICIKQGHRNNINYREFVHIINDNSNKIYLHPLKNYEWGDCGKQYGWLWRNWDNFSPESGGTMRSIGYYEKDKPIDQINELINGLKSNPLSRRHIITAWNPATLDNMALNACHAFVQFNCRPLTHKQREDIWIQTQDQDDAYEQENIGATNGLLNYRDVPRYYLDCQMYQRSADVFLGVPYNIASYALLTEILCKICNMVPGDFVHTFGDVHIYENHLDQVKEQLTRQPKELPKLKITEDLLELYWNGLDLKDFELENYNPHPAIKGKLSTGL